VNDAYRRIATAAERDRQDLFVSAARRVGITEQNVEKDFWVCWALDALFHGRRPAFSEDIDITVFREDVGEPVTVEDLEHLSAKRRRAELDDIRDACQRYLRAELGPDIERLLSETTGGSRDAEADVRFDESDPDGQTLLVRYPTVLLPDAYVRSEVRIECGAKSALDPHTAASLRPYVADDVPDLDLTVADVTTIQPERTFWDKVVIVHGLRAWFETRGELRHEGQRISRHYYDLHMLFGGPVGARAVADHDLGAECVRHARMFFDRRDFNLAAATRGTFTLTPVGKMLDALRRDYVAMGGMVIGAVPAFDDVMASVGALEDALNSSKGR
jgi:hypothetical protein